LSSFANGSTDSFPADPFDLQDQPVLKFPVEFGFFKILNKNPGKSLALGLGAGPSGIRTESLQQNLRLVTRFDLLGAHQRYQIVECLLIGLSQLGRFERRRFGFPSQLLDQFLGGRLREHARCRHGQRNREEKPGSSTMTKTCLSFPWSFHATVTE
jgi:hypothetical protein